MLLQEAAILKQIVISIFCVLLTILFKIFCYKFYCAMLCGCLAGIAQPFFHRAITCGL